jgi:hypothetical protein
MDGLLRGVQPRGHALFIPGVECWASGLMNSHWAWSVVQVQALSEAEADPMRTQVIHRIACASQLHHHQPDTAPYRDANHNGFCIIMVINLHVHAVYHRVPEPLPLVNWS